MPDYSKEPDITSLPPGVSLGFLLKKAQHAYRTRLDADLRPLGLTAPQYAALAAIAAEPGASNAYLARAAFVTAQTMQGMLSTLERTGLIRRTPHPRHGRVLESALTEQGSALLASAREHVDEVERLLVAATEGANDKFAHLLSQVVSRLAK